jgi:tetratricopeptide (TPR) repeat protein
MRFLLTVVTVLWAVSRAGAQCTASDPLSNGHCFAARADWKNAEQAFRAAIHADPTSADAAVGHARTLLQLSQPFDALIELEEFLKDHPASTPAAKLYAALCDTVLADHARGREALAAASRVAPQDAEVWEALAAHDLDRGQPALAARSYAAALALRPRDPVLLAGLAYCHSQLGESVRAQDEFNRALTLAAHKPDPVVFLLYGEFLLKRHRAGPAAEALTRALALDQNLTAALYRRALAREQSGDAAAAEADARAVLAQEPARVDAHMILQRLARGRNDSAGVAAEAQAIASLNEDLARRQSLGRTLRANLNRAEPLLAARQFAQAIPYYEEIVRILPDFYEAWFTLGVSYSQTGQFDRGAEAFRKFLAFQPLSADGHAAYGLLLIRVPDRRDEARHELERALELDPALDEARTALASLNH